MPQLARSALGRKERSLVSHREKLGQKVKHTIDKIGHKVMRNSTVPYGIAMSALGREQDSHAGIPPHSKAYGLQKHKKKHHKKSDDWVAGRQRHTGGSKTRLGGYHD